MSERGGEHLRRFRLSMRIGLRDAAESCGVSAVVFGEWERGKREFDFDAVSKLLAKVEDGHGA